VHIFQGAGFVTGVPIKTVAHDIGSSDHTSFLKMGIPAVQLFTGAHADYHRPTDTLDKIDPSGLVKTASVLKEAVEYLASRVEPLSSKQLARRGQANDGPQPSPSRRVVLGTVPDFSWVGQGVRLSGVTPGTPAKAVGLQKNDIIIRLNDTPIGTLADFANILRTLKAGDPLTIEFLRGQQQQVVTTHVVAR
jgi:C-terminal processing protease CtpA/Prc